jgi:hypothetical protein
MHIDALIYHPVPAMKILIVAESIFIVREHNGFDIKDTLSSPGIMPGRVPVAALTNGLIVYLYTVICYDRLFSWKKLKDLSHCQAILFDRATGLEP